MEIAFRAAERTGAFVLTVLAMLATAFLLVLPGIPDAWGPIYCLCFEPYSYARPEGCGDGAICLPPRVPPVHLIQPHLAAPKPPTILCEVPGDPNAVEPCEQILRPAPPLVGG